MFEEFLEIIVSVGTQWGALLGAAALISLIIQLLKNLGVIKDKTSNIWSFVLNLLLMGAYVFWKIFNPDIDILELDGMVENFVKVSIYFLGFIFQLKTTRMSYLTALKPAQIPGISKSFSLEKKRRVAARK